MGAAYLRAPEVPPLAGVPQCDGKVRYATWSAADRIGRETLKVKLEVYRCHRGHDYHLAGPQPGVRPGERVKRRWSDG